MMLFKEGNWDDPGVDEALGISSVSIRKRSFKENC